MIGDVTTISLYLHIMVRGEYLIIKLREIERKLKNHKIVGSQPKQQKRISDEKFSSVKSKENNSEQSDEIEMDLKKFLKEHQDYNEYIFYFHDWGSLLSFFGLTLNTFSVALSIAYMKLGSIINGLAAAILFAFSIIHICASGAIAGNQNDNLLYEVIQFPWYELSLKNQKIYIQMVHAFQNAIYIKTFSFGEIGLNLLTDIVKGIYNFVVYIMKFF
jgi:hypothetical protein